jgi:hypothetical protein
MVIRTRLRIKEKGTEVYWSILSNPLIGVLRTTLDLHGVTELNVVYPPTARYNKLYSFNEHVNRLKLSVHYFDCLNSWTVGHPGTSSLDIRLSGIFCYL